MTQNFHCFIQGRGPGEQEQPSYQSLGTRHAVLWPSKKETSGASTLQTLGKEQIDIFWTCVEKDPPQKMEVKEHGA